MQQFIEDIEVIKHDIKYYYDRGYFNCIADYFLLHKDIIFEDKIVEKYLNYEKEKKINKYLRKKVKKQSNNKINIECNHYLKKIKKLILREKMDDNVYKELSKILRTKKVIYINEFMDWLLEEAENNTTAMIYVGKMYYYGIGFDEDINSAIEYIKKAADKNCGYALYELGVIYEKDKKDDNNAFKYYKLSVEQNNAYGLAGIGSCYIDGKGIEKNVEEGLKCYRLSVEMENSSGQNNLGVIYKQGIIVKKDLEKALYYYNLSILQGNNVACYNASVIYGQEGEYEDKEKCFKLCEKSMIIGNRIEKYYLADNYYDNGYYKKALYWFKESYDYKDKKKEIKTDLDKDNSLYYKDLSLSRTHEILLKMIKEEIFTEKIMEAYLNYDNLKEENERLETEILYRPESINYYKAEKEFNILKNLKI